MAGLAGENAVVERSEQVLLIVVIHDWADEAERFDPLVHAEVVQDVQRRGMDGGGTRLLMDDVALVEHGDIDAGPAEHEADDKSHRSAAGDDDPAVLGHSRLAFRR